jgi:hypothetical protein
MPPAHPAVPDFSATARLSRREWLRAAGVLLAGATAGGCVAPEKPDEPAQPLPVYPPPPEQPRFVYERTITGSTDVKEETSTSRLRRLVTGESEYGQGFGKPFDCAVLAGRLYVSDTVLRAVLAFDFPGGKFFDVGESGPGAVKKPLGLAVDNAGRLYVCDGTTKRVQVFEADGRYVVSLGGSELLQRPSGVAVNGAGGSSTCR